jgi:hypothetical protein
MSHFPSFQLHTFISKIYYWNLDVICSAVYVLLSLIVASVIYCFEDTDERKEQAQEDDYREVV